jgi:dTDP-4-dehydrorhamnose 3,5-epimerase
MDIRKNSVTENAHSLFELFSSDPVALFFPRGLIHGWYFYENSSHIQAVSENYSEYGQDDNHGVHWNAPDLNIPWPKIVPRLSERAANFSTVSLLKTLIPS